MQANYANALCHLNATPFERGGACALCLGRKCGVRCGVARRAFGAQWSVARCAKFSKTQYGEFDNETAKRNKTQWHSKSVIRTLKLWILRCIQYDKNLRHKKSLAVF